MAQSAWIRFWATAIGSAAVYFDGRRRAEAQEAGAERVAPGVRLVHAAARVGGALVERLDERRAAAQVEAVREVVERAVQFAEMRELQERLVVH